MARDEDAIQAELDAVSTAISALVADPDGKLVDYTAGGRTFNKTGRMAQLIALRESLQRELGTLPCEEESVFEDPAI